MARVARVHYSGNLVERRGSGGVGDDRKRGRVARLRRRLAHARTATILSSMREVPVFLLQARGSAPEDACENPLLDGFFAYARQLLVRLGLDYVPVSPASALMPVFPARFIVPTAPASTPSLCIGYAAARALHQSTPGRLCNHELSAYARDMQRREFFDKARELRAFRCERVQYATGHDIDELLCAGCVHLDGQLVHSNYVVLPASTPSVLPVVSAMSARFVRCEYCMRLVCSTPNCRHSLCDCGLPYSETSIRALDEFLAGGRAASAPTLDEALIRSTLSRALTNMGCETRHVPFDFLACLVQDRHARGWRALVERIERLREARTHAPVYSFAYWRRRMRMRMSGKQKKHA